RTDRDLITSLGLYGAREEAGILFAGNLQLDARKDYDDGGRWKDLFAEGEGFAYWKPGPDSRHTVVLRASAAGGWQTRTPFQLTLGGDRALRGYARERFPGGRRVVFSVEDRIYAGWPLPDVFDLGATIFADLGRVWQLGLFTGLVLWLVLMLRAVWPKLREKTGSRTLVWMFTGATIAIGLMYGGALFFSAKTHLTVMEYWRWWVVHLWVEGFFEVFATAALSLLFAKMGLVEARHAGRAVIASSALFLFGGIPGTLHHLYFSGTPTSALAIGATFSALEVVPLTLIGFEALRTLRLERAAPFVQRYRWPIRFFVAVSFWNAVGAGFFGFLINPPIALYFMQGLNTTPVHAHTALFGVYGLLALGLCLVVARRLTGERPWNERALALGFWSMNIGLGAMVAFSLLPIGLAQTIASVDTGLWYARSADFLQQPWLEALRWLRMPGDVVFLFGVAAFVWFLIGLVRGHSYVPIEEEAPEPAVTPAE
ncbi:MAG: cbb3-type cytochrome c oxidase subunit I, partial [Pseudomonadota bacterium]